MSKLTPEKRREQRREYRKRYRMAHPELVREQERAAAARSRATHSEKKKEQSQASTARYRVAHPDRVKANKRAFHEARPEYNKEFYAANKDRVLARQKDFYAANKDHVLAIGKASRLRCKYKLSTKAFEELIRQCKGRCPCCKTLFSTLLNERPCVDHCHATGLVRGVLCRRCNLMIGHASDTPKLLRQAARYLEQSAKRLTQNSKGNPQ